MSAKLSESRFVTGALAVNYEKVARVRTMGALLAGVAAGVLGLTGLWGLLFFLACAAVCSAAVITFGCSGDAHKYFPKGSSELFSFGQLISGAMTYVLVWTVVYDAIYIF